ncbi:MAG: hypothetical protein ACREGB_03360, partial [Candidatus Saccharimonadales bacterium]
ARGNIKAKRRGRFKIWIRREGRQVRVLADLRNLDLALLKPIYIKTSPVYFERGFVTWTSSGRLSAKRLYSKNRIKIESPIMKSTVGWSSENEAVLRALNRKPSFELNFKLVGTPESPAFQGFDDSLVNILKKDFNPAMLRLIRARTTEELDKFTRELALAA